MQRAVGWIDDDDEICEGSERQAEVTAGCFAYGLRSRQSFLVNVGRNPVNNQSSEGVTEDNEFRRIATLFSGLTQLQQRTFDPIILRLVGNAGRIVMPIQD